MQTVYFRILIFSTNELRIEWTDSSHVFFFTHAMPAFRMTLQISSSWSRIITLGTDERFFPSMIPFVPYQAPGTIKGLRTDTARKWQITCNAWIARVFGRSWVVQFWGRCWPNILQGQRDQHLQETGLLTQIFLQHFCILDARKRTGKNHGITIILFFWQYISTQNSNIEGANFTFKLVITHFVNLFAVWL